MTRHYVPSRFHGDQARPLFYPAVGTHDAADRWNLRHERPPADWMLRWRAHVRDLRALARGKQARFTAREQAEIRIHRGPSPAMVAAVRFLRRHRRRARWAVRLRLTRFEVLMYGAAWIVAMWAWVA